MAMNTNNTKPITNSTLITNVLNLGISSTIEALCRLNNQGKLFKDVLFVTSELYKHTTYTSRVGKTQLGE